MKLVTGVSGKAGRAVVRDLIEHQHDVLGVDVVSAAESPATFLLADLTDFGQTVERLAGSEAVVHLAAIPAPGIPHGGDDLPGEHAEHLQRFRGGEAARPAPSCLGVQRDDPRPPVRAGAVGDAPIDEEHPPRPESGYALSKLLAEELGRQLHRWFGTQYVALRFSNIMEPEEYERFSSFWDDPTLRRWNLWGYVDARDAAQSCRLALEADLGAEHFIIAAADTVMNRPSSKLMAEVYPSVPYRPTPGDSETLLSIEKARKLLGYQPAWSWRDHVDERPD